MKAGVAARAAAARCVTAVITGESLERCLESCAANLEDRDRGLYRELVAGTLRHYPRLDALLSLLLDRPLRRRDIEVHALALIGLYQLTSLRVPAHAAISTTVDAAAALGRRRAMGLLNAVLRRQQREDEDLLARLPEAARHAHPTWLWEALAVYSPAQRAAIVEANNTRPPMTLRVNLSRVGRREYAARLAAAPLAVREGSLSPAALTLETPVDVHALPGFDDGLCSVQDEAAQLAARLLAPRDGERILDACAAPGGKTGHLLELAPRIELTAMDASADRLTRVRNNLDRLGTSATLVVGDAAHPPAELGAAAFNAMLVDVPCSATGVIRRHPDIKVLRRASDIRGFVAQQRAILAGLWPRLAPGGRLLYVTCSVLPAENSAVVAALLAGQEDAREEPLALAADAPTSHGVQLLPQADRKSVV